MKRKALQSSEKLSYDKEKEKPVIMASICNGERVAGFKNIYSGKFQEVMLIRDDKDLDSFLEAYDIAIAEIKTEW